MSQKTMPIRRFVRGLCIALAAVAMTTLSLTVAAPAQAAGVDALCTLGSDAYTFSPGLGLLPAANTFTAAGVSSSTCAVAPSGVTGVTLTSASGSGNVGCATSSGVSGTALFTWSDSVTSTVAISGLVLGLSGAAKIVTLSGTVSSGRFTGDTVTLVYLSTANTLLCLSGSLTNVPGVTTALTFTSV
ncbi:MAG: hypothetical protein WBA97_10445 [Actinophytocola sp.]|uniref:hypothetical protein n=1 Tax=Actinophytocola sp. TaxID=1872138 RepID=UPI003C742DB6